MCAGKSCQTHPEGCMPAAGAAPAPSRCPRERCCSEGFHPRVGCTPWARGTAPGHREPSRSTPCKPLPAPRGSGTCRGAAAAGCLTHRPLRGCRGLLPWLSAAEAVAQGAAICPGLAHDAPKRRPRCSRARGLPARLFPAESGAAAPSRPRPRWERARRLRPAPRREGLCTQGPPGAFP